jgi:hypothetical protein
MTNTKYLRDYLLALTRALWSGFGITDTSVVVLIVFLFLIGWSTGTHFEEHPPAWLVTALASALIVFEVLRTAYQLYAIERERREQLEQERVPQLSPEQPNLASTFKVVSPDKPRFPATYVRLPIRNTSTGTATRCSAKLLKIEFLGAMERGRAGWRTLPYNDTLDMGWANKPVHDSREVGLGPDSVDTLDVVYVLDGSRELHIASIIPTNYPNLMGLAGDYRFTLQLASTNAGSRTVRLGVHWDFKAFTFPGDPVEII